jgi:hypothetical protein
MTPRLPPRGFFWFSPGTARNRLHLYRRSIPCKCFFSASENFVSYEKNRASGTLASRSYLTSHFYSLNSS